MVERGIGKGLGALISDASRSGKDGTYSEIPVVDVSANPNQPRKDIDQSEIADLATSISANGVLQPILVRPLRGGQYELIAGERRLRASRQAGLDRIPAIIRQRKDDSSLELAIVENMAREDLNPIDSARACALLASEARITHEEVGRRVGKSRVAVTNLLRLLELPVEVVALIEAGSLSEGHGRAVLLAAGRQNRTDIARRVVSEGLSVRATERLARERESTGDKHAPSGNQARVHPDAEAMRAQAENALESVFRTDVRVKMKGKGGCIEIRFDDAEELDSLLSRVGHRLAL